jgi:hypothetical protein
MRIAHFSDLHVLDLEGVGVHRFLNKRVTGYAMLRMKRSHVHRSSFVGAIAREIGKTFRSRASSRPSGASSTVTFASRRAT